MDLSILQYLGTGLGVVAISILSLRPQAVVHGFKISVVSCLILGTWGLLTHQYGIAISQFIYVGFNLIGIYKWTKQLKRNKEVRHEKIS